MAVTGLAQTHRICQHGVEHRLKLAWRTGDNLNTSAVAVCCCSVIVAPQLVEQAGVLDGDHGLGGKVLDQLDLLVGERTDFLPVNADRANQFVSLSIGTISGPPAGEFCHLAASRSFPGRHVSDMNELLRVSDPVKSMCRAGRQSGRVPCNAAERRLTRSAATRRNASPS